MDRIYEPDEGRTMYSLETEDITFALWKKGERKVCGSEVVRTEHPKLFILENDRENGFLNRNPTITANLDIFTNVNSKFLYIKKYVRKLISQMYYDILRHKCELERRIMSNALALATISPEEVAYRIMGGPEYLAVVAGEVIHLVNCLRVDSTAYVHIITYRQRNTVRPKITCYVSITQYMVQNFTGNNRG